MAQHYEHYSRSESNTVKVPKHLQGTGDIRVFLAEFIVNFEFSRDMYSIMITCLIIYLTYKVSRCMFRVCISLIRPICFILLLLILMPYLYDMKSGIPANRIVSNMFSHTKGVFNNVFQALNSIYTHTIAFYAKNFVQ